MRNQIIETINKLFMDSDHQGWERMQAEVFTEIVCLDMSSMGMDPEETTCQAICEMWDKSFEDVDAVNHLEGNFPVKIADNIAEVYCCATATHFKQKTTKEKVRELVGCYDFVLERGRSGRRIRKMKYNLRYMNGNFNLE